MVGVGVVGGWCVVDEVADQVFSDGCVTSVTWRDDSVGDDLGVWIDGDVALISVETAGSGLVTMASVRIDGGDHPVLDNFPGDPEPVIGTNLDVLADHDR